MLANKNSKGNLKNQAGVCLLNITCNMTNHVSLLITVVGINLLLGGYLLITLHSFCSHQTGLMLSLSLYQLRACMHACMHASLALLL